MSFSEVKPERDDSYKSPPMLGTSLGKRASTLSELMPLDEATDRQISELDFAAYSKEEFTQNMEKQVMRRMFNAFDVLQNGKLDSTALANLCSYLGRPESVGTQSETVLAALRSKGDVTFDEFWTWWVSEGSNVGKAAFAMVCDDFSVPYHQQQLIVKESGELFTPSYRVNFFFSDMETGERRRVSPWHDIPLILRDIVRTESTTEAPNRFNFLCEIPKWTRAKFEIATGEEYNPIKQDIKNGVPRFYKHGDMMWNYGAFPQTWESTTVEFLPGVKGDNDPIDGIEIGMCQMKTGEVRDVKILGVLGMIDAGEMDWKLICINARDPIAHFLDDIADVPKVLPGCLDALREWLRVYKICQGGSANAFAFDGEFRDKAFALKILNESHLMWKNLKKIIGKSRV